MSQGAATSLSRPAVWLGSVTTRTRPAGEPWGRGARPRSRCRRASAAAPSPGCSAAPVRARRRRPRRCSGPGSTPPGPAAPGSRSSGGPHRRVGEQDQCRVQGGGGLHRLLVGRPVAGQDQQRQAGRGRHLGAGPDGVAQLLDTAVVHQGGDVGVAVREPVAVTGGDQTGESGEPGLRRGGSGALLGWSRRRSAPGSPRPWSAPPGPGPGRSRSSCPAQRPRPATGSADPQPLSSSTRWSSAK